jgi:hypothetical protein
MAGTGKKDPRERIARMAFGDVYPMYVQKAERKGRSRAEVDEIIAWLTGYGEKDLEALIGQGTDIEAFFGGAPRWNPKASGITGMICGYRVEEIEDPLVRKVRCLDKLIDELAKGKPMEKILR